MTNSKQCRNRNNHFEQHLTAQEIERMLKEDKADERMNQIARNGGDGAHYEKVID